MLPGDAAAAAEPSAQDEEALGLPPAGRACFLVRQLLHPTGKETRMPAKFELIAPCFFGCESTANFELRRIGAEDIRVSDGRLTFKGGAEKIGRAHV